MKLDDLICREAQYMLENKATVRETGKAFGRGKSTIHKDMREKLPEIDGTLATEVAKLLNFNLADRARRGGVVTSSRHKKVTMGVN